MIMAAIALGPRPRLQDMRVGLAGNLCRCTDTRRSTARLQQLRKPRIAGKAESAEQRNLDHQPNYRSETPNRSESIVTIDSQRPLRLPSRSARITSAKAGTRGLDVI
jgi:xanthine dehydrogenase iron-sulfur cluster and FAD-binding subunit A